MSDELKTWLVMGLAAIGIVALYARSHCWFFFHTWDTSRVCTDLCTKCGAIRFKTQRPRQ